MALRKKRATTPESLNPKQQRFVEEYLVDLNATQAAIRAGYSARTATQIASRLLTKANVQAAVIAGRTRLATRAEVTAERIVEEYRRLGFSSMRDFATWDGTTVTLTDSTALTEEQVAAVAEVAEGRAKDGASFVKIKLHDKKGALDSLARHLGMFVERHEHTGKDGAPLVPLDGVREILRRMRGAA